MYFDWTVIRTGALKERALAMSFVLIFQEIVIAAFRHSFFNTTLQCFSFSFAFFQSLNYNKITIFSNFTLGCYDLNFDLSEVIFLFFLYRESSN